MENNQKIKEKKKILIIAGSIIIIALLGYIGFMLKDKIIPQEEVIQENNTSFSPPLQKPNTTVMQAQPQQMPPVRIEQSKQFENTSTIIAPPCTCEKKEYNHKKYKPIQKKKNKETIPPEYRYPLYY